MELENLSTVCSGLGIAEEDDDGNIVGYTKGEFCLDNLRDLQGFLRRDDPEIREVFKLVCKWDVVPRHLIPIVEHCHADGKLVVNAVKVLVFLTMPINPGSSDILRQAEYYWRLKAAFMRNDTITVITSLLVDPLEHLERGTFSKDDWKIVQLVLTLFRNILAIQEITSEQKASASAVQYVSLRDKFLGLLFYENITDLILVLAQNISDTAGYFRRDNILFMELFYFIFMGQDPEMIAKSRGMDAMGHTDIETSLNSLKSLMETEDERRRFRSQQNFHRHTQFSGTFTQFTMDGSKALLRSDSLSSSSGISSKTHIVPKGTQKRIAENPESLSLPKGNILCLLHDFVSQFMLGTYNVLMQSVRDDIEKEHVTQSSDIVMFYQVAHFATTFHYSKISSLKPKTDLPYSEVILLDGIPDSTFHGDICGPIAATMNEAMFLLVFLKWRDAFDTVKQTNDYRFLSAAGSIMKDMINMLVMVLKLLPEDSEETHTARILLYKIFYDQTDQGMTHFLMKLIRSFDPYRQSKSDLAELVEMMYSLLQLTQTLQEHGTIKVAKKSRKGIKKSLFGDNNAVKGVSTLNGTTERKRPTEACQKISLADNSSGKDDFGVASPILYEGLQSSHSDASEENNGQSNDVDSLPHVENVGESNSSQVVKSHDNIDSIVYEGYEPGEADDQPVIMEEVDFSAVKLVASFANNSFIHKLCWLLKFYRSNSIGTNCKIISILQRICDDLDMSPILFQLSLLTTFLDILDDHTFSNRKEYAAVVSFLKKLVRKMLKGMKSRPLLFVEILFWKTHKECCYINTEFLLNEVNDLRKCSKAFESNPVSSVENDASKGTVPVCGKSIADALGDDEADFPFSHREEELPCGNADNVVFTDAEDVGPAPLFSHHRKGHFAKSNAEMSSKWDGLVIDPEDEATITNLYQEYKDNNNCARLIADALDPNGNISAVQVSAMLNLLHLKVVSKRKKRQIGVPFSGGADGVDASNEELLKDVEVGSVQRHSLKRVQAFSTEQEMLVKQLFEQYKTDKKCCEMIANALDAGSTFTEAEVSCKLRQLGLIRRQRRSKHSREADITGLDMAEEPKSDDETLMDLKRRKKSRQDNSVLRKEVMMTGAPGDREVVEQEDPATEILNTLFKKKRNANNSLSNKEVNGIDVVIKESTEAPKKNEGDEQGSGLIIGMHVVNEYESSHHRGTIAVDGDNNVPHHQGICSIIDELDDGEDQWNIGAFRRSGGRRKAKVVLDLEDDE